MALNVTDDLTLNPSNATDNTNTDGFRSRPGSIFVPVIHTIFVVLGCLGNFLVVIVVVKNRGYRRNTTNLFILNLAIADILFLLFCVPFHAVIYAVISWPLGEFMCKFIHFVQYFSMVASVLLLVAMSTDRYLAVAHPLLTRHLRTPKTALTITIVIWVIASGVALPWPIFYTVRYYYDHLWGDVYVCADDWGSVYYRSLYFLLLFLFAYAFPLVIIVICSVLMVRELWLVPTPQSNNRLRPKQKVTRLVVVVVAVFLICWFPFHLTTLWISYGRGTWKRTMEFYYLRLFAHCLSYANSCMNPIIYAFLSENFRRGFKEALQCKTGRIALENPSNSLSHTDPRQNCSLVIRDMHNGTRLLRDTKGSKYDHLGQQQSARNSSCLMTLITDDDDAALQETAGVEIDQDFAISNHNTKHSV